MSDQKRFNAAEHYLKNTDLDLYQVHIIDRRNQSRAATAYGFTVKVAKYHAWHIALALNEAYEAMGE